MMEYTHTINRGPEEAEASENLSKAFRKVMDEHGYATDAGAEGPLRREDLPEAIRRALIASEPNTDKITGRFIGRIYDRIMGRLDP